MSEKKVYAMAPEGCAEYLTAGRVYRLLGGDHSAVKVVDDDGDEIYSAWKGGGHLNGRNWTRLELTEEEAEAINNGSKVLVDASDAEGEKWVVADPQGDDEVSEIEWSPWIEHDGHKRPDDDMLVHVELVNGGGSFGLASRYIWSIDGDDLDIRRFSVPAEQYNDYMSIPTFDDGALYSHPNSEPDADECSVVADTLEYDPVDVAFTQDNVNTPSHYTSGDIECIDAIRAQMTPEQFAGYLRGNLVKYVWRYEHKGGVESLRKAEWYLRRLIDVVE